MHKSALCDDEKHEPTKGMTNVQRQPGMMRTASDYAYTAAAALRHDCQQFRCLIWMMALIT